MKNQKLKIIIYTKIMRYRACLKKLKINNPTNKIIDYKQNKSSQFEENITN